MLRTRTAFVAGALLLTSASAGGFGRELTADASWQTAEAEQEKKQEVKVVHRVEPVYPGEARRTGIQGKVVVAATIETTGEVSDARAVSGHRLLNQAAIDAMKKWRFSNTYDGPVTLEITFEFHESTPTDDSSRTPDSKSPDGVVKLVHRVDAVYPEEARRAGVQGEVIVDIAIDEKGAVIEARVKSGPDALRQAAVDAVRQFRFSNAVEKTVLATMTFNFVLGKDEKEKARKPQA